MSDLHELLTTAARDVDDPRWASADELRLLGRRRSRRRRATATVAVVATAAAVVTLWAGPGTPKHGSAPLPVAPAGRCLVAAAESGRVASPYRVLVGGRQVLEVDLATGAATPQGSCGSAGTRNTVLPVRGARVVSTLQPDQSTGVITVTDPAGRTRTIPTGNDVDSFVSVDGRLVIVRQTSLGSSAHLDTYDVNGRRVSTLTTVPVTVILSYDTVGGIAALSPDPNSQMALVDPIHGNIRRVFGPTNYFLGADQHQFAWLPGSNPVAFSSSDGHYPMTCQGGACPPLEVTDAGTGATRDYPPLVSGRVFTSAVFSPDDTQVALAIADDADMPGGASVTVLTLATGATTTIPGIHSAGNRTAPSVSWTPDSRSLVIADTDAGRMRLMIWHRSDGSLTQAATLVGDPTGASLQVIGPTLEAWG
jgi:hypothetical protein